MSGKRGVAVGVRGRVPWNFYKYALKLQENPLLSVIVHLILNRTGYLLYGINTTTRLGGYSSPDYSVAAFVPAFLLLASPIRRQRRLPTSSISNTAWTSNIHVLKIGRKAIYWGYDNLLAPTMATSVMFSFYNT